MIVITIYLLSSILLVVCLFQVFNAITHMVLRQKKDQIAKANEQSGVIKVKKDKKKKKGRFC